MELKITINKLIIGLWSDLINFKETEAQLCKIIKAITSSLYL